MTADIESTRTPLLVLGLVIGILLFQQPAAAFGSTAVAPASGMHGAVHETTPRAVEQGRNLIAERIFGRRCATPKGICELPETKLIGSSCYCQDLESWGVTIE